VLQVPRWLIRLRWATAGVDAAVVAVILVAPPSIDVTLDHLTWLIAAGAGLNAVVAWKLSRGVPGRWIRVAALTLDVVLLTGLLDLTGGPFNPFTVVYGVQVAVATLTLGRLWGWAAGIFAISCYGVLIYWHTTSPVPGHHRLNDFPTHLFTMWTAIAAAADLVAYFQGRFEDMRAHADRNERLASLTTLAAGAAHELSTPLATIAIAARELERSAAIARTADLTEDARLIREEVDRCQAILDQMSGRAGGLMPDEAEAVDPVRAIADLRDRLPSDQASRLQVRSVGTTPLIDVPRAGFGQVVASLVKNAFEASADSRLIDIEVAPCGATVRITVKDEGTGMTPDVLRRAGEPFFTTKAPGRGLGLGLFLAHVFAERCGGTLMLESGGGTTAVLQLPARPDRSS
jgi:two-component system sensor histidine kinase RegB